MEITQDLLSGPAAYDPDLIDTSSNFREIVEGAAAAAKQLEPTRDARNRDVARENVERRRATTSIATTNEGL